MTRVHARLTVVLAGAALAGCGSSSGPPAPTVGDRPGDIRPGYGVGTYAAPTPAAIGPVRSGAWRVAVRVRQRGGGPLRVDVDRLRRRRNGVVSLDLVLRNTGRRSVQVDHSATRRSRLIGPGGREPLAADEGCGYAQHAPGEPIRPGACRASIDAFRLAPGATGSREIGLLWDLPGRGRMAPGEYTYVRAIRHRVGARRVPDVIVPLTFVVSRVTRPVTLFFWRADMYAVDDRNLARVKRRVPVAGRAETAVAVVRLLARGPTAAEEAAGLAGPWLPGKLRSARLTRGRMVIDLERTPFYQHNDQPVRRLLARTLFLLAGVREIEIRLEGSCTAYAGSLMREPVCERMRRPEAG